MLAEGLDHSAEVGWHLIYSVDLFGNSGEVGRVSDYSAVRLVGWHLLHSAYLFGNSAEFG